MPEDIPEELAFLPEPDPAPEKKPEGDGKDGFPNKFYTAEWIFAVITLGTTFGFSESGFPPNIELACVCWAITLFVALHYFWVLAKGWRYKIRWIVVILVPTLIVYGAWNPVANRYRIQHSPPSPPPTDTNVLRAVYGLGDIIATIPSTPPDKATAVYENKKQILNNDISNFQQQYVVPDFSSVDLQKMKGPQHARRQTRAGCEGHWRSCYRQSGGTWHCGT
jgi:hypothetical protein